MADESFRLEVKIGAPIFFVVFLIILPASAFKILLLLGSYTLILVTELINTSVERLLERIHPEEHELIGESKDIASASVLLAFVFAILVIVVLLGANFGFWYV